MKLIMERDIDIDIMTIYDDYIRYDAEAKVKYGKKSVVLMQVGSFFEIYAVINASESSGADIHYISSICDVVVSKKNKSVPEVSRANPLMAGFPEHAIQKFLPLLIDDGFTVVLVRQVTPPPNPKRAITDVLSAATRHDVSGIDNNFLLCLFLEYYPNTNTITAGAAIGDVTTGETFLFEIPPSKSIATEIRQLLHVHAPKEVVLMFHPQHKCHEAVQMEDITHTLKQHVTLVHDTWECSANIFKPAFQEALFHEVFPQHGNVLTATEYLHLERRDMARNAFALMIGFLQQHSETLVYRLRAPEFKTPMNTLSMEFNSLIQLNITSHNKSQDKKHLLGILQAACSTPQGARLFKARLLNPSCDPAEIQQRFVQIEAYISDSKYVKIREALSGTGDFERWIRKIALRTLPPMELPCLHAAITAYAHISQYLGDDTLAAHASKLLEAIDCIDLEEAAKYNQDIKTSIFKRSYDADLDDMQTTLDAAWSRLRDIQATITNLGRDDTTNAKIDFNERDGYYITITKKRLQTAKSFLADNTATNTNTNTTKLWDHETPVSQSSQIMKLLGGQIKTFSDIIILTQSKISVHCQRLYKDFLDRLYIARQNEFYQVLADVSNIDVNAACAHNAVTLGHTRPTIKNISAQPKSYINAKGLRHPIIENLGTTYHPNDIFLEESGLLLYGINASGKSCLMKSIGIAIIMAQAGMYVPCNSLEFYPYTKLFTRISTGDDIYQGHSTFMVEMLEFRHILKHADAASLVLGDEIAAGTEAQSALAIVAAGVHELAKRNSTFIFTTHLHDLLHIDIIKDLKNVSVKHLHAYVDSKSGEIIYDRTLRPGNGETNYGLLVCEALKMPLDFIRTAQRITQQTQQQQQVQTSWVDTWRPSRYNPQVIVSKCALCGEPATETHHVTPQASLRHAPNHIVNARDNLMPLCTKCHDDIHNPPPNTNAFMKDRDKIFMYLRIGNKGWMCRPTGKGKWSYLTDAKFTRISKLLGDITIDDISEMESELRDVSL